jgi:hypothetical protein
MRKQSRRSVSNIEDTNVSMARVKRKPDRFSATRADFRRHPVLAGSVVRDRQLGGIASPDAGLLEQARVYGL